MPINWWGNKQIVVYPYDRILLNNIKKEATDTYNGVDESQKYFVEDGSLTQKTTDDGVFFMNSRFLL